MNPRDLWTGVLSVIAASMVAALSFVATPVKFAATDVPLGHLLAVGRVTFRASLACEITMLLPLFLVATGRRRLIAGAAAAILAAQWLALMPTLDARALVLMAGGSPFARGRINGYPPFHALTSRLVNTAGST